MSDRCCSIPESGASINEVHTAPVEGGCPTNHKVGKPVDSVTLKALLARPLTELRPVEYRFCPDAACPTVYYSMDGLQTFSESDLREHVYQKPPRDADTLVCYCFRYTVGEVRKDAGSAAGERIVAAVKKGIRDQQCACDVRNPQGSCCLGNITSIVHHAMQENGVDPKNNHSRRLI